MNLATETARVRPADGAKPSVAALVGAVERARYRAAPRAASDSAERDRVRLAEERSLQGRLLLAVACGIPLMLLHHSSPMTRSGRTGSRSSSPRRFQWFAAWPFHARAVRALRHRAADMNTLIALGTFSAYLYSAAVTLWPGYFRAAGIQERTSTTTRPS